MNERNSNDFSAFVAFIISSKEIIISFLVLSCPMRSIAQSLAVFFITFFRSHTRDKGLIISLEMDVGNWVKTIFDRSLWRSYTYITIILDVFTPLTKKSWQSSLKHSTSISWQQKREEANVLTLHIYLCHINIDVVITSQYQNEWMQKIAKEVSFTRAYSTTYTRNDKYMWHIDKIYHTQ